MRKDPDRPPRTLRRRPVADQTRKDAYRIRQEAIAAQQYACAACRTPADGNSFRSFSLEKVVLGYLCSSCHAVFTRFARAKAEDIAAEYLWSMGDWAHAHLSA